MPLHAHSCGAVVVQLLYTATTTVLIELLRTTKHQCCWLSMSIGGSGGTENLPLSWLPPLVWRWLLAVAPVCCLGSFCAVLPGGMVPDIICPGVFTYVFWVGAVFCDLFPFLRCVVSYCSSAIIFFVAPRSPGAPVSYRMTDLQFHFLSRLYANTSKHVRGAGREFTIFGFRRIISNTYFYANTQI